MNLKNVKIAVLNEEEKISSLKFDMEYDNRLESHEILINVNSSSNGVEIFESLLGLQVMVCSVCEKKFPESDIIITTGIEPYFCECGAICNPEYLFDFDLGFLVGALVFVGLNKNPFVKNRITEKDIENTFVCQIKKPFQQQVKTPYGIIDILTDDYIYEVKLNPILSTLHNAYGQLKHYQHHYPDRKLAIVANKFPEGYFNKEVELIICEVPE